MKMANTGKWKLPKIIENTYDPEYYEEASRARWFTLNSSGFDSDEYYSAVAKTVDEARKLLEAGFEYVCQKDDIMLFRKRK